MDGVYVVCGPMCGFDMRSVDAQGEGLVKKETRWMTNSPELAEVLEGTCSNKEGLTWPRHVQLINGRAKEAKQYPPKLVEAILRGLRRQLEKDFQLC
eukprot:2355852-Karenia_brevis.AAC.1